MKKLTSRQAVAAIVAVVLLAFATWVVAGKMCYGPVPSNQTAAAAALRRYLNAQKEFLKRPRYGDKHGRVYANPWMGEGFPDLRRACGPESGAPLSSRLDKAFADAGLGGAPRAGYHFCDILGDKDGPYDFTKQFGLCAFPHEYGRTGRYTYVVNEGGTVYYNNIGGFPVNIFPDVDREGWLSVGSDDPSPEEPENVWNRKGRTTLSEDVKDFINSLHFPRCRISSTECAAVAALRTYLSAQNQFHRTDFYDLGHLVYANPWNGSGLPDLYKLGGIDSGRNLLKIIDRSFAEAKMGGVPRAGYYFCEILGDKTTGPFDFSIDCGLCAFPAEHNRTGRNTFIIDVTGVVYQKDTGGWPVWIYPADPKAEGWVPVGSE